MIENKLVAGKINEVMLEFGEKLDNTIALVRKECSQAEFEAYRGLIGKLMGDMLLDIMNPLYSKHPDLKPAELD